MIKCEGIYCRQNARKRLKDKGLNESEAREVSDEVYSIIKSIVDKHNERL